MKIWLNCSIKYEDNDVWLGLGSFKHHKDHKWKGWTLHIYLFKWMISFNYVSNWKEYNNRMKWRKQK